MIANYICDMCYFGNKWKFKDLVEIKLQIQIG